tara:strand:+ start:3698 stop:4363 length:666 start_codon:yes stop_codon:yes gene_type:complete
MSDVRSRRFILVDVALTRKPSFRTIRRSLGEGADRPSPGELVGWLVSLWSYCEDVSRRSFDDPDDLAEAAGVPRPLLDALAAEKWIQKRAGGRKGSTWTVRMWQNSRGEAPTIEADEENDPGTVSNAPEAVAERPRKRSTSTTAQKKRGDKTSRDETSEHETRRVETGEGGKRGNPSESESAGSDTLPGGGDELSPAMWARSQGKTLSQVFHETLEKRRGA